ncbi:tRNA (adenosine(37)-N6)-threonylcarbamoyltransferase complex dimerization subunit type 1 TsaB [Candidatus Avelusimicrobium luingense]|uniref:tRNA (adenosine(37)-N6)-threonylcarbamoyltransferase complex dimerization subunit type 1 TsaB n=1 Tax=Candidatus Avelusimicrobium luingense TaxID=3416211 RepID=UPI003D0D060F
MQTGKNVIVGLDTSASPLLVAVQAGEKTAARRQKGIKQERLLFPVMSRALTACESTLQDVKKVCIVRGPGRFTGIRIGLTFASMMKYLNQAEVYGATLFEIIRRQVVVSATFKRFQKQYPDGALGVVLHAFREEYFLQIFDGKNGAPMWLSREELLARLAAYTHPIMLAGTDKNNADLDGLLGNKYPLAAPRDSRVRPQTLLAMAQDDTLKQDALEPLYLKPARFELITPK